MPVDTAGLLAMTQHARHVSYACCDSYCVCIVCVYSTSLAYAVNIKLLLLPFLSVTKIGCPPFCPGRCFAFENSLHCCDSMCVAGCSGGTTESHCVVSGK